MTVFHSNRLAWLGFLLTLAPAASCMHGPPTSLSALNPFLWREWSEDERYGPTPHERLQVLQSIERGGADLGPDAQERLARDLAQRLGKEPDPLFRGAMVEALGALPSPTAVEALRQTVDDSNPSVRIAFCKAWGRRRDREALDTLARLLNSDTDLDVRLAAARELQTFRDPAAVRALGLALDDPDPALQHRAVRSLQLITGRHLGDSVPAWRELVQRGDARPSESVSLAARLRNLF